jgi:hypothetical protein
MMDLLQLIDVENLFDVIDAMVFILMNFLSVKFSQLAFVDRKTFAHG